LCSFQQQFSTNDDVSSRVFLAERYLARCAYQLADIDESGLQTRKAARLTLGKIVLASAFPFYLQSCKHVHKEFVADAQRFAKEPHGLAKRPAKRRRPRRVKEIICVDKVKSETTITLPPNLAPLSVVHTDSDGAVIPMDITANDLSTLNGTEWLNDAV
jgi:hypothetical protein